MYPAIRRAGRRFGWFFLGMVVGIWLTLFATNHFGSYPACHTHVHHRPPATRMV